MGKVFDIPSRGRKNVYDQVEVFDESVVISVDLGSGNCYDLSVHLTEFSDAVKAAFSGQSAQLDAYVDQWHWDEVSGSQTYGIPMEWWCFAAKVRPYIGRPHLVIVNADGPRERVFAAIPLHTAEKILLASV